MVFIWLCIVLLLLLVEMMTTNLIAIYFAVSGLVSLIISLIADIYVLQFLVFLVLGIILLALTRVKLQQKLGDKSIFSVCKEKFLKKGKKKNAK